MWSCVSGRAHHFLTEPAQSNVGGGLTPFLLESRQCFERERFFNRFLLRLVVHSVNFDVQNLVALLDREPNEISSLDVNGFIADTGDGSLDVGNDRGFD